MSADDIQSSTEHGSAKQDQANPQQTSAGPADLSGAAGLVGMKAIVAALNHLLSQHANARQRLAAHQSSLIRIGPDSASPSPALAPPQLWFTISADGLLEPASAGEAQVELLLKPSLQAGIALVTQGAPGLTPHLRVEGNVLLAGLIAELIQDLNWDYEDDLANVIGEIPARRIGRAVAAGRASLGAIVRQFGQQVSAAGGQAAARPESPVTGRPDFDGVRDQLKDLNDRLDALEREFGNVPK